MPVTRLNPHAVKTGRRKALGLCVLGIFFVFGTLLGLEGLVWLLQPQVVMFPRWVGSDSYGFSLPPNRRMVHQRPRHWRFEYGINEDGNRGVRVPIEGRKGTGTVLVLGDSYSMGVGVNDGQEYPAVMDRLLRDRYRVVNTGVGGWGLPQEVRRFYEFGLHYEPEVVILQFCFNDIGDGARDAVIRVDEDGQFVFQPTPSHRRGNMIKQFLSTSPWVQNSQLYSFLRHMYERVRDGGNWDDDGTGTNVLPTPDQELYVRLLDAFARDLGDRGIPLWMIAVDGQLEDWPWVDEQVRKLEQENLLVYYEVRNWFSGHQITPSPEGHEWGVEAHRLIGEHFSRLIIQAEAAGRL